MKKIMLVIVLFIILLFLASRVSAGWGRLVEVSAVLGLSYGGGFGCKPKIAIVYDKLEKVNCYIVTYGDYRGGVAIDCLPAK